MEIIQLCNNLCKEGVGHAVKLPGARIQQGPIPVQIYSNEDSPFAATVYIEGTIASDEEVNSGNVKWSVIGGAIWTAPTLDALFAQPTHIRVRISEYVSGSISIRIGF